MDFTNLKGIPSQLAQEQKLLRRSIYIAFANTRSLQELYSEVRGKLIKYVDENVLPSNYDEDILFYFLKSAKFSNSMEVEQARERLCVEINAQPLLPSVKLAPRLKFNNQVVSKMERIGFQHLHMLSVMKNSSESNTNTSDSDNMEFGDSTPKTKRLRTCQKAIEVNCGSLLEIHSNRSTNIGTTVHVDILIYVDASICKQLSKYLGLIYIEQLVEEAEEKPFEDILPRLDNENSKVYKLIQSYINKYLITGYNNICLVHHVKLWEAINANARAFITSNVNDPVYVTVSEMSNFQIILVNEPSSFLTYVEAVSTIIDKALNCKCHVIARYQCGQNLYSKVKLSLSSIIPLHILRYFSQCKIFELEYEI